MLVRRRPEAGHQLIRDSAVQERAHGPELFVEVPVQFIINPVPAQILLRTLKEPVQ